MVDMKISYKTHEYTRLWNIATWNCTHNYNYLASSYWPRGDDIEAWTDLLTLKKFILNQPWESYASVGMGQLDLSDTTAS